MPEYNATCAFLVDKKTPEFNLAFTEAVFTKLTDYNGGKKLALITKETLNKDTVFSSVKFLFSTWNMPVLTTEEIKSHFPSLQCVFYAAGTVKYFAKPYFDCSVRIFCANAQNAIPVAEFAAAEIVLASKGVFTSKITPRTHFFKAKKKAVVYAGNNHAKVGILGAGHVGRLVIGILQRETDLDILIYDPYLSADECTQLGCQKSSLETLFKECDIISNHMPDIDATKGLISSDVLDLMKPTAGIINTGRGAQIVEKDLVKALKECVNRFAILDVTFPEPIRPWNPLLRMKNVYITPHIAGSMGTEIERLGFAICNAYESVAKGQPVDSEVFENQLINMA